MFLVHDSTKDKEFELEMSWIGNETDNIHSSVPQPILEECIKYAKEALESAMQE